MKKTIIIFLAILVGVFVILSLLDSRGEYVSEKALWRIDRKFSDAVKSGEMTPVGVFEDIISQYEKFVEKYSGSKLKPEAQLKIGRVYMAKKDFEEARNRFQLLFTDYPNNFNIGAEAALAIGKSYEMQNNWAKAESVYKKIMKDYPLTNIGFNVPLYIGNYYKSKKDTENARAAYDVAIQHYRNIVIEYPNSPAELNAIFFISNAYMGKESWSNAIESFGEIILKYPNAPLASTAVKTINIISLAQMRDTSKAITLYKKFIEKHPKHPLSKILDDMIDGFAVIQSKNITIVPKSKK